MKKILALIPVLLGLLACGILPRPAPDVSAIVNATLTAITQDTAQAAAPAAATTQPSLGGSGLTAESLHNAVYRSPDWGEFQLSEGVYYRTPLAPGESLENYTTRLLDTILYGDLNADGLEDAVAFLTTQNGGTGHFIEMAAVLNLNGSAINVSTLYLGDRIVVEDGVIQNGVVTLNLRVHGQDDGLCCPSRLVTQTFHLAEEQLVEIP